MNKITTFRKQKDGSVTFRRCSINELVEEIRTAQYAEAVKALRVQYPLLQRESEEARQQFEDYYLQKVPYVCFALEKGKIAGEVAILGRNPLLLLKVSSLQTEQMAQQLRQKAVSLPYTRLAFVGADGHSLNIVCEVKAILTDQSADECHAKLLHRAYMILKKVYEDQLLVEIDQSSDPVEEICRMSADADLYFNPESAVFHVDMSAEVQNILEVGLMESAGRQSPVIVQDREDFYRWRRIYVDNLRKAQSATFTTADPSFECLLLLARYCHETGVPQALAVRFASFNGDFTKDATLLRDTFATEYNRDLAKINPDKHLNPTAQLMLRTSQFLNTHFLLRKNVLNGVVEYRLNDGTDFDYHLLTEEVQNTMTIMALESGLNSWDKDLNRYIHSKRIPEYDPVNDWLNSLPEWDGVDRIADIARRVPTDTPNWERNFHLWMRSVVAQWMGRDEQHGNAIAPILIGAQATGKSSFCRMLLPEHLLDYYNDSIHFKDDKSVFLALSSFALINIDEFDSLSRSQQPLLKYLLSKTDVKFRGAYKSYIEQHKRYASFIGTTNKLQPLNDPTGSRRFVCVHVTGSIDFLTPMDYEQIYAQLRDEVSSGQRYWFTKDEADEITRQNTPFQKGLDLQSLVTATYRMPRTNEDVAPLSLDQIVAEIREIYPNIDLGTNPEMRLGKILKNLGFITRRVRNKTRVFIAKR